jgi:hypothetical protein
MSNLPNPTTSITTTQNKISFQQQPFALVMPTPTPQLMITPQFIPNVASPQNVANISSSTIVPMPLGKQEKQLPSPPPPQSTSTTGWSRGNLPKKAVEVLKKWLFDHFDHPYPSDQEKTELAKQTCKSVSAVLCLRFCSIDFDSSE